MELDNFFKKAQDLQLEKKGRTLPITQLLIMYEIWLSDNFVPVSKIIKKYAVPKYAVSNGCSMLSKGKKDKLLNKGEREGKNWIYLEKKGRFKYANFTIAGKKIAERLFSWQ